MILLIDNYDSFSYNLFQYVGTIDKNIRVIRNDELTVKEIDEMSPSHIILSPGPGKPKDAGICEELVKALKGKYPILGVCLGHQAICESFGATVGHSKKLMHGKTSVAKIDNGSKLFKGFDKELKVGRYHSLSAVKDTVPECLKITAETDDGEIMAVEHNEYPIYGLQFHPESILTQRGIDIIRNFLNS
ncbi:MAG: aminodeoxychorismate/anthranilate synthase component II [Lachnospiraceae bacterium]|nr:aminodeoxychorismate/anthranilate synthase component II [Lachnospiraceae bacterium]